MSGVPEGLTGPVAAELDGLLFVTFQTAFGATVIPGNGGLLAATRAMLDDPRWRPMDVVGGTPIDRAGLVEHPNPLWERQGVVVCSYPAGEPQDPGDSGTPPPALLTALRVALIDQERLVLGEAVRSCRRFLAARRIGTQPMSTHPAVAQRLAALVADALELRAADTAAALASPAGRRWLTGRVDAVGRGLIALSGGRALLAGGAVHLRTLLLTVNRIHLAGPA